MFYIGFQPTTIKLVSIQYENHFAETSHRLKIDRPYNKSVVACIFVSYIFVTAMVMQLPVGDFGLWCF